MERIVYRKTLDVHKNGIQFTLQGFETADNLARRIELSLMASGDTFDLPLEQMVAMIYVTTPKANEPSINECTIKDNTIIYEALPIVEEGVTEMQLKLIDARPDGANRVIVSPKFAVEVTKSGTNDESVTQSTTFTALEDAVATAKGVYDSRLVSIELSPDCTFRANYADGTYYESEVLKTVVLNGESLIAKSYARGGTGVRAGEDTDNSMYYSNVSRSASEEADRVSEETTELLQEVTKHGVYTAFSVNFETGDVEYISPSYTFGVNEETGELEAYGIAYTPDERYEVILNDILAEYSQEHETKIQEINSDILDLQESDKLQSNQINTFLNAINSETSERISEISRIENEIEEVSKICNSSLGNAKDYAEQLCRGFFEHFVTINYRGFKEKKYTDDNSYEIAASDSTFPSIKLSLKLTTRYSIEIEDINELFYALLLITTGKVKVDGESDGTAQIGDKILGFYPVTGIAAIPYSLDDDNYGDGGSIGPDNKPRGNSEDQYNVLYLGVKREIIDYDGKATPKNSMVMYGVDKDGEFAIYNEMKVYITDSNSIETKFGTYDFSDLLSPLYFELSECEEDSLYNCGSIKDRVYNIPDVIMGNMEVPEIGGGGNVTPDYSGDKDFTP